MKREILINATPRETRVAILEDEQLVELLVDRPEARRMVGDIYFGRVEAVLPGIQAAFVDIGTEKSAFLHASDLVYPEHDADEDDEDHDAEHEAGEGPDADEADDADGEAHGNGRRRRGRGQRARAKAPPIQDVLKRGQDIIVQVSKEPISTKGPRVTAQISLAGRFLVFMPFASRVGVSRKIGERAERSRLREMVEAVLPKNSGGVIARTVGEDATQETFKRELDTLINQWKRIKRKTHFVRAPALIHRETNLTRGLVRDLFSEKVESVTVDSKQVYNEILEYLKGVAPDLVDRVKLWEDTANIFDKAGIEPEIRDLFKRRCDLPAGGYLIIEPTEALVSVDVNSGRYTGKKDPEKTILRTNLEAAREVARQIRLRDIGGIIVCDFIDMETKANRDRVLQELRNHLSRDRARTKAFAVSDLGLIEMTRQRVRQSHLQNMTEPCPTCAGTGRVFTAETIVRRVERSVRRMGVEGKKDPLVVKLHPDVAMYVLEEEKDLLKKLEKAVGFGLEIRDDPLLRPDEFKLVVKSAGRDVTQQYAVA
ncbi:MAG: Rne/Rng family ribonuclease [Gemmatimonadota bacterium]|nr:Rne/Rng family ribonuclease [Gemmatimonadota bacterium]HEU4990712.1 Rne/Rng family ribonuclease [Gemmatimonadaceae bacterium]